MLWTYEEPSACQDDDELITLDQAARSTDRGPHTLAARAVTPRPDGHPWLRTMLVDGERYTTMGWMHDYLDAALPPRPLLDLEALITRLADDPVFWSYVLARWMAEEGLDGQDACRGLGIARPLDIMLLAGLSCPCPGSEYWEALVAFSGRYCHADFARLRAVLVRYKRSPGSRRAVPMLEEAVRHGDDAFMARPLVRWQALHDADDQALGAYLGLPAHRLGLLAYYPRPMPGSVSFRDDLRFLARQCNCDAARLEAVLLGG